MRLPHNAPLRSPLTERFSAEDISFIQEWLEAVDEECATPSAGVLHPPTLHWTAKLLDNENQETAPKTQATQLRKTFDFSEKQFVSFGRSIFYAGVAVAFFAVSLAILLAYAVSATLYWYILPLMGIVYAILSVVHYRRSGLKNGS